MVLGLELVIAGVALALTAALAAASLSLSSFTGWALAAYLFASAEVVLLLEGLSVIGISPLSVAAGEAVALSMAAWIWHVRGRSVPPLPRFHIREAIRGHKVLFVLAMVVAVAMSYELVLVLATPPNNGDSLTYHLTRAAAWLQARGIHEIPGPAKSAENDYPPNAEIEILYTFVFLRGDAAAALTQFFAQGALILGVYGCARRLAAAPPAALFARCSSPRSASSRSRR